MTSNKKGLELSINAIILIALGLMVLLLGLFFVMNSGKKVTENTGCEAQGGDCSSIGPMCPENQVRQPWSCTDKQKICCKTI